MNSEENKLCNFCKTEKPLFKALAKTLYFEGWKEETFYACKDCIKLEDLKEVIEVGKSEKKQKAA